jgi:hypothetical protein
MYINPPLHTSLSQFFAFLFWSVLNKLIIIFIEVITGHLFVIILIFTDLLNLIYLYTYIRPLINPWFGFYNAALVCIALEKRGSDGNSEMSRRELVSSLTGMSNHKSSNKKF